MAVDRGLMTGKNGIVIAEVKGRIICMSNCNGITPVQFDNTLPLS
jgi:hypothetical protein